MQIEADLARIYSLLNDEKPAGITVETAGSAMKALNLNVNLNVDLTMIINVVAVSWILARATIQSRSKMKVNGQLRCALASGRGGGGFSRPQRFSKFYSRSEERKIRRNDRWLESIGLTKRCSQPLTD